MPLRDRGRRLAYKDIDKKMPNVASLLDLINNGISIESSYGDMIESAGDWRKSLKSDISALGDNPIPKNPNNILNLPEASAAVSKTAGELMKRLHVYYEQLNRYRGQKATTPSDFDVIDKFRNYAEHAGGGTHIPMCYVPPDRKESPLGWELAVDLATILQDVGRISRLAESGIEALINLPQNDNGIINLSEPLEAAIAEALEGHIGVSDEISLGVDNLTPDLEAALATAKSSQDFELEAVLQLHVNRNALRLELAAASERIAQDTTRNWQ